MSEDRFREVFRRVVSETPDPPPFKDLETHQAAPRLPMPPRPWMAAVVAAVLILVVVGIVGALGGGGPDLAAPDDGTIGYVKVAYTADLSPVCEGGTVVDNGGFEEATIEIWGPTLDNLTLMVATFPDGSTERTVIEGSPADPETIWVSGESDTYPAGTRFRVVDCAGASSTPIIFEAVSPTSEGGFPSQFFGPPSGYETWGELMNPEKEPVPTEWNGNFVLLYEIRYDLDDGSSALDFYVTDDGQRILRVHAEQSREGIGTAIVDYSVVEAAQVPAESVSFDTAGLNAVDRDELADDRYLCPVTIPSQGFTPPDGYPPTPANPNSVWFGKDELWTALSSDGTHDPRKSVWWSVNFLGGPEEPEPELTVRYTLLNSPRSLTFETTAASNAYTAEDGWFIIAGIDAQYSGCWEVTAVYKDASLTYVYYNPEGADPKPIVPDVVGMTVERAGNVLHDAGYQSAPFDSEDPEYEVCAQEPGAGAELSPGSIVGLRTAPVGGCAELMSPTGLYNRAYQDLQGRKWYGTDCPAADIMVGGGIDAVDGLPRAGETTMERVDGRFQVSGGDLATPGTLGIEVIPRMGEVWDYAENGDLVVFESDDDYLIKVLVDETFECPSGPYFWNGIPVAFILVDIE